MFNYKFKKKLNFVNNENNLRLNEIVKEINETAYSVILNILTVIK